MVDNSDRKASRASQAKEPSPYMKTTGTPNLMSPVLVLDLVSLVKVSIGVAVIFFLPQENSGRGELHQIKTKMLLKKKKRPFLGNLQLAYSGFQIVEWVSFLLKSLCAWNRLIPYKKNGLSVHNIEKNGASPGFFPFFVCCFLEFSHDREFMWEAEIVNTFFFS